MENQIEIYQSAAGQTEIAVKFDKETIWLNQRQMAALFDTTVPNINMHIKNVFDEGELLEKATIQEFLIVRNEGQREVKRNQKFYNLDVIISVGYRIKSQVATRFRQWATQRLKDYLVQGYTINEKRLAQKQHPYSIWSSRTMVLLMETNGSQQPVSCCFWKTTNCCTVNPANRSSATRHWPA